jgi:hypothetical protein
MQQVNRRAADMQQVDELFGAIAPAAFGCCISDMEQVTDELPICSR